MAKSTLPLRAPAPAAAAKKDEPLPVVLDLGTARQTDLIIAMQQIKAWAATQTIGDLPLKAGWNEITPELALHLLARNSANRPVTLKTVIKYARSMVKGDWHRTGQAIIFDVNGVLLEGQHRLLAALFSGASFTTYVVTDAPDEADLFAYIDNNKPRDGADALATSGENGQSRHVNSAVKVAIRYDAGGWDITRTPRQMDAEPIDVLHYVRAHPNLPEASAMAWGNFQKGMKAIGHDGIATFCAWQIIDRYGFDELHDFMEPFTTGAELAKDSPILALRERLRAAAEKSKDPEAVITLGYRLALVILAFNLHYRGEPVLTKDIPGTKKQRAQSAGLHVSPSEPFPTFPEVGEEAAEAAEAA